MRKKRRLFLIYLLITGVLATYIGRLFVLQLTRSDDWIAASVRQREDGLVLDDGRGRFVDRNGRAITAEPIQALAMFPGRGFNGIDEEQHARLAQILGMSVQDWTKLTEDVKTPQLLKESSTNRPLALDGSQLSRIESLRLPGLAVVPYMPRYTAESPAEHLIGFVAENPEILKQLYVQEVQAGLLPPDTKIGVSGLESSLETYIRGREQTTVSMFKDGQDRPLAGLGNRLILPQNPHYPLKVHTTIDLQIQRAAEETWDRYGASQGAIVILDVKSGDLAGMVSRPGYDPALGPASEEAWTNHALEANVPGSVFKLVVAAAALEYGLVDLDDTFECDGSWDRYHFHCWKREGHGRLTFQEAFEQSCNIAFAELMLRLTPEQLESTARAMGLLRTNGWSSFSAGPVFRQFDREDRGQLFAPQTPSNDEGVMIQTAIGQRDVRLTALQAANMVATLVREGNAKEVRAVDAIRFRTGGRYESFESHGLETGESPISAHTATLVRDLMLGVVRQGTAEALRDAPWSVAGKTGTAELGPNRPGLENHWFVGFAPVDDPQYAFAVLVMDAVAGSRHQAVGLTKQLLDRMAALQ